MTTDPHRPCNILLTGASGGLGRALAKHYARRGTHLVLSGRNPAELERLAQECRASGATANVCVTDLMNVEAALDDYIAADRDTPFDMALFASGQGDVRADGALVEDGPLVARLCIVNFTAPAAVAAALADRMAHRGSGTIVLIGSAAGFHALPFAAAYAASKSGLAKFAEALRTCVRPHGVGVTLVSPGFIDTAAARKVPGPKPFMLSPAVAVARIADAAERGKAHLVLPWPFVVARILDGILPRFVRERLYRALAPPPS